MSHKNDFSEIFHAQTSQEIGASIQALKTDDLFALRERAAENVKENLEAARVSWFQNAGIGLAMAVGAVGLSQPIAKWRKWTELGFFKYISHPAALGAAALSAIVGVWAGREGLKDANSVEIEQFTQQELVKRINWSLEKDGVKDIHVTRVVGVNESSTPVVPTAPAVTISHAEHQGAAHTVPARSLTA